MEEHRGPDKNSLLLSTYVYSEFRIRTLLDLSQYTPIGYQEASRSSLSEYDLLFQP
jgi:hypothetical protein